MATRSELYEYLSYRIPSSLSEEWDNDGIMCLPHNSRVGRILLSLDATRAAAARAVNDGFDLIITHHPMIFRPVRSLSSPKMIELVENNIAVFSFHTRLDAVDGGVNDALAELLGLTDIEKLSMGRIGTLPSPVPTDEFAEIVKDKLSCGNISYIKRTPSVRRVAVLGGDGKDFVSEAEAAGADTYLTGSMSYNTLVDADEGGINVIEAGHYNTEFPVLRSLQKMIYEFDSSIETEIYDNNPIVNA